MYKVSKLISVRYCLLGKYFFYFFFVGEVRSVFILKRGLLNKEAVS